MLVFGMTTTLDAIVLTARMPNIARAVRDLPRAADKVADVFQGTLVAEAPRKTGLLVLNASVRDERGAHGTDRYSVSVGPFSRLGYPTDKAPSGRIKSFVNAHKKDREIRGTMPPVPSAAWWYLTQKGKGTLLADRLAGKYGMAGGKPRYWQALVDARVPDKFGGMRPKQTFLEDAHLAARYIFMSQSVGLQRLL